MKFKLGNTLGTLKKFGGDLSKWAEEAKKLGSKQNLDDLQLLVDLAGMFPGYGAIADLLNAVISLLQGDWTGALFSAWGAVPVAGDAAKGAKIIKDVDKYLAVIGRVEKNIVSRLPAPIAKKLQQATTALENELRAYKKIHPEPPKATPTPKKTPTATPAKTQPKPAKTQPKKTNPAKEQPRQKSKTKTDESKSKQPNQKQGKTNNNQKPSGKKQTDGKSKPKKKLECGDFGTFRELKKITAEGKFDRDHIPAKAALWARARELNNNLPLTEKQTYQIEYSSLAIAIPQQAHIDFSPTHSENNPVNISRDAKNLAKAARRDIRAMLRRISRYDRKCKKVYFKASRKIIKMTNKDYDKFLQEILDNPKFLTPRVKKPRKLK